MTRSGLDMNLRTKFILWTGVLIVAMTAIISFFLLYQERDALKDERGLRGVSLVKHLAELSKEPLLLKDDLTVHSVLGDIVKNEADVVYAYISDISGKRAFFASSAGRKEEVLKMITGLKAPESGKVVLQRLNSPALSDITDFSRDIAVQGKTLGAVRLGISDKGITATLNRTRNRVILFSLGAIVGFAALAFGLITFAVRPIKYLSLRARAVGEGDLDTPIILTQRDELGELADSLDWMVKKLKQAQEEKVEKEKLRKEMEIARQIQQRLLPRNFPRVKGFEFAALFEPAQEIGGDFYDIFPIEDGRLGFAIGDVAGKSISGALLMVLVRTLLRAEALDGKSPKEVLVRVNHFLRDELAEEKRRFVTLQYNVLNPATRSVTCTSAGHPSPLHLSRSHNSVKAVPAKGMALGVAEDGQFSRALKEKEMTLGPGDGLFLYTDGITEVVNGKRDEFGEEGLMSSLERCLGKGTKDILSTVKHDIVGFAGTEAIQDDVTMLLIKGVERGG